MDVAWKRALARVFEIDPRGIAAMRIGVGVSLLADLLLRTDHFSALYTDAGAFPRRLLDPWMRQTLFPIHQLGGSFAWQAALWAIAFGAALAMAVGWRTRIATAVSWALLVSLQARNPLVLNFGDAILRMALFWAIFLPTDARWALDARKRSGPISAEPIRSVAGAAYLLQICFIYFFTALMKSGADWHDTGLALYYALNVDYLASPLGLWVRQFLPLTILMTRATLILETIGPFLLLMPIWWIRAFAAASFIALHLGIAASLDLGIFPWVDVVILLPFLPSRVWDEVERRLLRVAPSEPEREDAPRIASPRAPLRRAGDVLVGVILLYVLVQNVQSVSPSFSVPEALLDAGHWLSINQKWQMFTPDGPRVDGWYVLSGRLANGEVVDLVSPEATPTFDKPELVSARHTSSRWARYMFQMKDRETNQSLRHFWARWQCSSWNRNAAPARRLDHVDMWFVLERTPPPGRRPVAEPELLLAADCPAPRAGAASAAAPAGDVP